MRKFIIFIAIAFCTSTLALASKQFDKLLTQFEASSGSQQVAIANQLMKTLNDEQFTDELYQFSTTTTPVDSIKQQVWYWSTEYYYDKQDYSRALQMGKKALPLCRGKEIEADCLNVLALSCFRMSRFQEAATFAKQCYALDEKSGDPDVMSSSLNTLAGIYLGANQPLEAEKYILKAINLAKKVDNPARMSVLQGKASEVYHALVNDEKALEHINIACDIEKKLGRDDMLMVRNAQKASVLIGLKRYKEAEALLKNVIPFMRKVGDKLSLGISCNKMGKALLAQGRNREAIPYYREAAKIFVESGDISNEMHSRRGLYESLWTLNPDSAKMELDRFDLLKDSLYSNANAETLARYNAEFGIDELQKENEHRKHITSYVVLGAVVVALLLALLVWWLMRRRMRVREEALQATINALRNEKPESTPSTVTELTEQDEQLLQQVVASVKKGMENSNVNIEAIASEVCLSRSQLNRRIKSITGVTTQQYVNRVRLEQARELLANESLQVSEVAYHCGFDDVASFSRAFRRTFGVSPSQHRNSSK
ncbi:MAG: helix-turn-helix domain-containing protein [Muribaculaceae bacterium]|nr:helix-turn-helix domain-containing protein [Muribaculaceae bacterium]